MKIKNLLLPFMLFFCITAFAQLKPVQKIDLKVLYVGGSSDWQDPNETIGLIKDKDSIASRTNAFKALLENYFTNVAIVNGSDYQEELSAKYDVTIFDGRPKVLRDRIMQDNEYYNYAYLHNNFSYPAMFLVENAENLGRSIGTKTDWFCLCLAGEAYNMNLKHDIFNIPFKVTPTLELKDTPKAAFEYQGFFKEPIPKKVQMWKVQNIDYANTKNFRVGMVSRPWGFKDTPDTEVISGGVSAKSPDAVAIARHGNFFFWGFSASPKYMTDEAKVVFANAVVYTSKLKGERLLGRKYNDRISTKANLAFMGTQVTEESYHDYINMMKEFNEQTKKMIDEIKAKQEKGETLNENEKMYLQIPISEKYETIEEYRQQRMGRDYEQFKDNIVGYQKYLKDNTPYYYTTGYDFVIDEDVKSLKIANTDPKILDKAISLWENGTDIEKAKRILDRYTLCTFETPQEWRTWYNKNADNLIFTQNGGWVFLVNTKDESEPANNYDAKPVYLAAKSITLAPTSDREPVSVGAALAKLPGGRMGVVVKFKIHRGYHIYSALAGNGAFTPTTVKVSLPDGYGADALVYPATTISQSGTPEYLNEVVFYQPIYGKGGDKIKVTIGYQCCDNSICFPPTEKTFELEPIYK